jgi:CHAD domain-containing protein
MICESGAGDCSRLYVSSRPLTSQKKINKIFADLRYVRQVLGPCRDLDVNIALVKSKGERCGNASVENAWGSMQRALESQRQPLIERVRRDIASQDLFKFVIRVQRLIDAVEHDFDPLAEATVAMAKSMNRWEESFTATREQPDAAGLHTLRIAGKKLRYRAELLSELDPSKVKPLVTSLREIQTTLGDWHDRSVLLRHVAEFIGRPGFLADHPDIGRILLAEMEKERLRYDSDVTTAIQQGGKVQQAWATWRANAEAN